LTSKTPLPITYARCTLTPKLAGLATGASVSAPQAARTALLRAVSTVTSDELRADIDELWNQVRLVSLIHHRLDGSADPVQLVDLRETLVLVSVVGNSFASKLGEPPWSDPVLRLSRDLPR
jgi:hypothetical protein